jgi:glycosyltransferase involved in cell wall biosynthesis
MVPPVWPAWRHYPLDPSNDDWGASQVQAYWRSLWGETPGILWVIWDPGRLYAYHRIDLPVQRWAYTAIDSTNINGTMGGPAAEAITSFDRVLAYGKWASHVVKSIRGRSHYLPHGLNLSVYSTYSTDPEQDDAWVRRALGPHVTQDALVIGCVATNQPRKDLGLYFHTLSKLKEGGHKVYGWLHTDVMVKAWSVQQLVTDFNLVKQVTVTGPGLTDQQLSLLYRACDVTIAPGLGEGFGYPIVESLACFPAGTLIQTDNGSTAIEDLQVHQSVFSHLGARQPVRRLWNGQHSTQITSLEIVDWPYKVRSTHNHPWLIFRCGNRDWVEAHQVREGDYVCVPRDTALALCEVDIGMAIPCSIVGGRAYPVGKNQSAVFAMRSSHSLPEYLVIHAEFARFLGYWVAEGWAGKGEITFCFGYHERELASDCAKIARDYLQVVPRTVEANASLRVSFSHALLARLLAVWFGTGARNKTLPDFLIRAPFIVALELLRGMWLGDGTYYQERGQYMRAAYATASWTLALQVRRLLHRFGIPSSLYQGHQTTFTKNLIYQIRVCGRNAAMLGELLGLPIMEGRTTNKTRVSWADADYVYYAVRAVETLPLTVPVYNLQVAIDESYQLAGGFAVHNCGVPVIHGDFGGGVELVPKREWRPPVREVRLESVYALKRPVFRVEDFANAIDRVLEWRAQIGETVVAEYCRGAVAHLDWQVLWPRWHSWIKAGL